MRLATGEELLVVLGHFFVTLLSVFEYFTGTDVRFVVPAVLLL